MTSRPAPDDPKAPSADSRKDDAAREKAETEEEKIRREQAVKPALMPIGDPAGAA